MNQDSPSFGLVTQWLAVFCAGGLGASLRVLLSGRLEQALADRLPFAGVLSVNLIGCFLIGFASVAIAAPQWRSVILGGLLGGFTTYSAFALFSVELMQQQRIGALATQLGAHLVGGVVCVAAGMWLAQVLGLAKT